MWRTILAIALILVMVATCMSCKQKETITEAEIPIHYTTYTDEMNLFSISYPPDWEPALSVLEEAELLVKEVIDSIEAGLPLENSSLIFIAGLPTAMGWEPNVNIGVESIPGVYTHDEAVEAEIQGLRIILENFRLINQIKTTVDGREATIIEYKGTMSIIGEVHPLQMLLLVDKVVWVVTCSPPQGEFDEWEDDFYHIVRSLRILR